MKPAVLFIALSLLVTVNYSCKKHTPTTTHPGLTGKWQFVLMTGGIANVHLTEKQWGHTKSYIFAEKSKCTLTMDNDATVTTYKTYLDTSYSTGGQANFVEIGNGTKYEYSFRHDTLLLADDIRVDGMTEWYVKVY